jgi:hypothetical protein
VIAGVIGSVLAAVALVAAAVFAGRATRAAARMTSEAQRATALAQAEPAQRQADLQSFKEIRDELKGKIERQDRRIDGLSSLVIAYSWTVDRLIFRMRDRGVSPEPGDVHDRVRQHMDTGT